MRRRDRIIATLFEIFCIWPAVLITMILFAIFLLAVLPIVAYYIIKKRWFGNEKERKDLEDSRKGSHRD